MAIWNPFGKKKNQESPVETPVADAPSVVKEHSAPGKPVVPAEAEKPVLKESPKLAEKPVVKTEPVAEVKKEKTGLFSRFRQAVKKTVAVLNTDIRDLVGKEGRLVDDVFLEELFAHLVKTDMGTESAAKIRDEVGRAHHARKVTMEQLADSAKTAISEIMAQESAEVQLAASGPTVIMVVGVNGSGKTTSIAKLTYLFRQQGKTVVLGAGDTFRAAAVEQLKIWADRLGAEFVSGKQGGDPASIAYKAVERAHELNADICIVDTAGRLQTQTNLMDQLTKIRRVMSKIIESAPHEVLLVLDATAGQNALSQAKGFSSAAGCTGIVLAKLDGTAKGGVAIPIRKEFGLPVKFIGLGETPDAFAQFNVEHYVNALFDLN